MKKMLFFAAFFVFVVTIGVAIYAVINIASVDSNDATESPKSEISNIEQYAAENYPEYDAEYHSQSKTLTLKKQTDFSLQSAPSIYNNPYSYLNQTQIFALDISLACSEPDLIVVLCYVSKDGEPMLSVGSDGTITQHWK